MQIQFYHLLTTPLEVALPRLADMAVQKQMRTLVMAEKPVLTLLDDALWSFSESSFVPHKRLSECAEGEAALQPVLLHDSFSDANQPVLCMVTNNHYFDTMPAVQRIFDVFNGNDAGATDKARTRWLDYKNRGIHLTYVKQKNNGGWETVMNVNAPV
jgi:DNA polymerase III subunit chi